MAIYKLHELCNKIFAGKDIPKKNVEGHFPIFGNGIGTRSILGYTKTWFAPKNSITISARGTIGHVIFHDIEFTPVIRLITLISNEKIVLPKYLFYKLKTLKFQFTGAAQKQLIVPIVKEMKLNIPYLNTQQQIIDIIEPVERTQNQISLMLDLVEKTIIYTLNDIKGNDVIKINEIIELVKVKKENKLNSYGIGVNGIFKNNSSSKLLKRINIFEIGIGYVRQKHIDIGINEMHENCGISPAYKILKSQNLKIYSYILFYLIKNNFYKWSIFSARATGGMNIDKLLNDKIFYDKKKIERIENDFIGIIKIKVELLKMLKKINKIKSNLLISLVK